VLLTLLSSSNTPALTGSSLPWLTAIFHGWLAINHIPSRWLDVKVIFIPKAGQLSHITPKDFRPISISSFLVKTLERLVDTHIGLTTNPNLLSNAQHAYPKAIVPTNIFAAINY